MGSGKIKKVGNVTLDYSFYKGEDLYSEGPEEDALLEVAATRDIDEFNRIIALRGSWNFLYHLSHLRGNIVDFLNIAPTDRVLEVGAGCGAITGVLSDKAASVTCIELSEKRSLINAYRHRDCSNIEIIIGNFQDIEKKLVDGYDYILLIGVLEYAAAYMEKDGDPFLSLLLSLTPHLSEGGRIVTAIENKYGMKYFSGAREDHTGRYFDGITGYRGSGTKVRTFSKKELEDLFKSAGLRNRFYYPYPDYKLPVTIYSDERMPSKGEFGGDDTRNFDAERFTAFDEAAALDEALDKGFFDFFSNSYLIVSEKAATGGEGIFQGRRRTIYSKHSNERDPAFQIRTDIEVDGYGKKYVVKYPLHPEASAHLENMNEARRDLTEEFSGTIYAMNDCVRYDGRDGRLERLEFEYLSGRNMSDELERLIRMGRRDDALSLVMSFAKSLRQMAVHDFSIQKDFVRIFGDISLMGSHTSMAVTDLDLLFPNLIWSRKRWNVIDYEWTLYFPVPVEFVIWRAFHYYLEESGEDGLGEGIFEKAGIREHNRDEFMKMELSFQRYIAGRNLSIIGMHSMFGRNNIRFGEAIRLTSIVGRAERIKLYLDEGNGFNEESVRYFSAVRDDEDRITLDYALPLNCRGLRLDPADVYCMLKFEEIEVDGASCGDCLVNGIAIGSGVVLFNTSDPQILFTNIQGGESIHISYYFSRIEERFWKPISAEFDLPVDNEGSSLSHMLKGTRSEYMRIRMEDLS